MLVQAAYGGSAVFAFSNILPHFSIYRGSSQLFDRCVVSNNRVVINNQLLEQQADSQSQKMYAVVVTEGATPSFNNVRATPIAHPIASLNARLTASFNARLIARFNARLIARFNAHLTAHLIAHLIAALIALLFRCSL